MKTASFTSNGRPTTINLADFSSVHTDGSGIATVHMHSGVHYKLETKEDSDRLLSAIHSGAEPDAK